MPRQNGKVRAESTSPENFGIVPRAIHGLFERMEGRSSSKVPGCPRSAVIVIFITSERKGGSAFTLRLSFLQIYSEPL